MNILYIAASFPKPEDGATIYTDLAEELNKKHCILVIAPDQKIKIGTYKSNVERQIKVYRVGIFPYFNVGFIAKGISTISQSFFLKIAIRKILTNHQVDLLLYESPPTTNVNIISRLKKKYNCKTIT